MNLTNVQTSVQSQAPIPRTLIADDQADIAAALHLLLREAGYQTEAVTTPAAVLDAIKEREFDLVLMDLNYARDTTSGQEGLDLISNIKSLDSTLPVVVLTGWGTVELAVEAMHRGVHDFVQKPWDNHSLLKILRDQIELGRQRRRQTDLDQQRQTVNEQLQEGLAQAREIQMALLPNVLPNFAGFDVSVAWTPAQIVSGDYFDLLRLGDRHAGICVADVAGKGMSAALLMSNVQAVLKSFASDSLGPAELCTRVNSLVCENIVPNRFISCFYALLDTRTRKLAYTNAGHYPPMLVRNGEFLRLTEGGPVLGVLRDGVYQQDEIELLSGDCLVLFTDGVTEARDGSGDEFGEARLQELLNGAVELSAAELRDRIMGAVNEFSDGQIYDDATLMIVKVD